MEKLYKKIRRLKPGTYDDNRFLTKLFRELEKKTNEIFERTVEVVKDKRILGEATYTVAYVIKICNPKYRNLEGSNVWYKSSNKGTKIIALTTALNDQKMKFKESQKNHDENGNNKIKINKNNPSSNPGCNKSKQYH